MPMADLIPALHSLRSRQLALDGLTAACTSWAADKSRPLEEFLDSTVPMGTAVGVPIPDATMDHVPNSPQKGNRPPGTNPESQLGSEHWKPV